MDKIWLEIDYYWQVWREGILWTRHEILKNISYWSEPERIECLEYKVGELEEDIAFIYKRYERMTQQDKSILYKRFILLLVDLPKREKLLKGLKMSLRLLKYPEIVKGNGVSPEMIAQARDYPLSEIVEVNSRGFAHCVNHFPDRHPSMYCKKNFAHCYVCSYSGDVIDVFMKLHKVNFIEAVKKLQGGYNG